jgi:hypothetical protein
MCRLPPVCHTLKPRQLRDNIRLSARSVSARPRPRAVLTLRVTRGTCRPQLCASKRRSLLVQISGMLKPSPIPNHRRTQPRRGAGPLRGARAGSARTAVRDPLREPPRTRRPPPVQSDRQQRFCQRRSWRVTELHAGRAALDLVVTPKARPMEVDQADRRRTAGPRERSGSSRGSRSQQATSSRSRSSFFSTATQPPAWTSISAGERQ